MKERKTVIIISIVLLPLSLFLALAFGAINVPTIDLVSMFVGQQLDTQSALIIEQIRLPRALLAAMIGALLGICGATTQGLFRNPLADPSLIGVTAGASAGAALAIFFADNITPLNGLSGLTVISIGGFIGGGIAVVLVYRIATDKYGTSVATMLLAGIAITAIAGSLTNVLEFFGDQAMLRRISLWRMGGLDGANYSRVIVAAIFCAVILTLLPRYSTALNALLLGESEARHLGVDVQRTKLHLILFVAAGVGAAVALAGTISFVGLIVPHIVRLLIGPDHRYLLPISALGGAILVVLSDTIARSIMPPIELPVGLITALLGAPFFISLLHQRHKYGMR